MTFYTWSTSPAANGTIDATINMAEGMAPSAVNDGVRAVMAAAAKYRNDEGGSLTTNTSSVAYVASTSQVFDTLGHLNGAKLNVQFHATNGAAPTLNIDGLGAKPIQVSSGTAVTTGFLLANSIWPLTYNSTAGAFILNSVPAIVQAGTVTSTSLAAAAVQYSNIQNVASNSILGNPSSTSAATVSEMKPIGAVISGQNITFPVPPPSSYKNLTIKVASNTTVTCAADYITVFDGTNTQTLAFSGTVDLGSNGAVNKLDAGTIAIDTWYAIWAIAKSDGTAGFLASTSSSAPTMPSGYTFKARVGWVRTQHGSAILFSTWQLGKDAQYISPPTPAVCSGSTSGTFSITSVVPTATASKIRLIAHGGVTATGFSIAPNASYALYTSSTNPPPLGGNFAAGQTITVPVEFVIESTSIVYSSGGVNDSIVFCLGWTDNL